MFQTSRSQGERGDGAVPGGLLQSAGASGLGDSVCGLSDHRKKASGKKKPKSINVVLLWLANGTFSNT